MYKKIMLTCLIPLSMQATEPTEFVFHSPKTSTQTALLTGGAGIGAAFATYYGLASLLNYMEVTHLPLNGIGILRIPVTDWLTFGVKGSGNFTFKENAIKNMVFLTAGAAGALAAYLTYSYQPEGKFSAARDKLLEAFDDSLLNELLNAQDNLLENIDHEYIQRHYPRVAAYHDFIRFHKSLKIASAWLKEAAQATDDQELANIAADYITLLEEYLEDIHDCIHIIKNEPDWLKQLKGYELRKTRKAQEELVVATRMAAMCTQDVYVVNR